MPITVKASQIREMVRLRHGKDVGSKLGVIRPFADHWDDHIAPSGIADNP